MKKIILVLTVAFLPLLGMAATAIDGAWLLTDRVCSNDRQPMDNVNMDTTTYNIEFQENSYKAWGNRNGHCEFEESGFFKIDGKFLVIYTTEGRDCHGNKPTTAPKKMPVFISPNEFSITATGPVNASLCGSYEFLISTFTRQ